MCVRCEVRIRDLGRSNSGPPGTYPQTVQVHRCQKEQETVDLAKLFPECDEAGRYLMNWSPKTPIIYERAFQSLQVVLRETDGGIGLPQNLLQSWVVWMRADLRQVSHRLEEPQALVIDPGSVRSSVQGDRGSIRANRPAAANAAEFGLDMQKGPAQGPSLEHQKNILVAPHRPKPDTAYARLGVSD